MKLKTAALALASLLSFSSFSQFRKYSNEFLNIGAGARGLAMGGAQIATVQDGTAGYWNPAGLTGVKDQAQVNLMHAEYFAGIGKYDYLSIAIPTANNKRTIGVTALRFAVDDIMNTLFLVEPDGSINYNNIKSFSSADYAFLFSLAQKLKESANKNISFGINAKVIHRSVGSFAKAWGFGIDAGLQIKSGGWHFGIAGRDITTTFNSWSFSFTEKEKEALYLTNNDIPVKSTEMTAPRLVLGAGRDFRFSKKLSLLAEANFDLTFDGRRNTLVSADPISIDPKIGAELNISNSVFLRGGINNFQRALSDGDTLNQKKVWIYQPSAGVGFRLQNVRIDYAFVNLANQSSPLYTHVFSLQLDLVNNKNKKKK
ncbi:PorV/PorQ family protein [Flavisolibacter ginsenosidimutans]|uniref:PorV/PorQ family protein n=1 Tax=Flavisolibacter ginsenosidimutans TaxID=661481 RepID=A0A5B8UQW7_9BACT|nr:PorV/PorQ family protein [Flavisolibacter ginsenosidimutans]QEC58315.1 PorV/PorQ family protein [Flavisolibacter ginsenosidimutans]